MKNLTNLKYFGLNIYACFLKDEVCESFSSFFEDFNSIETVHLDLSFNEISDSGPGKLFQAFEKLDKLSNLKVDLKHNEIMSNGAKKIG